MSDLIEMIERLKVESDDLNSLGLPGIAADIDDAITLIERLAREKAEVEAALSALWNYDNIYDLQRTFFNMYRPEHRATIERIQEGK